MKQSLKERRVLIVDDDEATRLLSTEVLGEMGLATLEAPYGKKALDIFKCHANEIVLILTDIKLPDISDYELIKQLKRLDNKLPIIAISALSPMEVEMKCEQAGATHFLSKPLRINEFEAIVKHYVETMILDYEF